MNHSLNVDDIDLLEIVTAAFEGEPDRVRMHLDRAGVPGWLASTHLRDVGWSTESLREEIVDEQDQKIEEAEEEGFDNGREAVLKEVDSWHDPLQSCLDDENDEDLRDTVAEFLQWLTIEMAKLAGQKVKAAA